jgi:hypothetical protein
MEMMQLRAAQFSKAFGSAIATTLPSAPSNSTAPNRPAATRKRDSNLGGQVYPEWFGLESPSGLET